MIEYREGIDSAPSSRKLPGLKKYGNITFKRGIVSGDNELSSLPLFQNIAHDLSIYREVSYLVSS